MIYKWNLTIPQLGDAGTRRAYIYLPDSYSAEPGRRFPVMYMFDGHNVFFDRDAAFGKSWGMNDYMKKTGKNLIIVAVECNQHGRRLQEYSPVTFENELGRIEGAGKEYMDWLVGTLKPAIDKNLRTLPDRKNTIICGSSMGGLMALYAALKYNRYFQRAACLSPSLWVAPNKLLRLIARAKVNSDTCIYMDYGSEEMGNHAENRETLISAARLLITKPVNLTFRIVPGGSHCEASWEKQIPVFMECLGL